jgi:hypothetical protein
MWPNLRYRIIADFSWPSSEDIDKTSQLTHWHLNPRTSGREARWLTTTIQRIPGSLRHVSTSASEKSQQRDGIYEIRLSYHDTEGLLTSHHICGYFKKISRLYRPRVNSRIFIYTFTVTTKLKAYFTGFSALQYYKWCVNGQHSYILLKRVYYLQSNIAVRIYYFGGLLTAVQTLQLGRREGHYVIFEEKHYGECGPPPPRPQILYVRPVGGHLRSLYIRCTHLSKQQCLEHSSRKEHRIFLRSTVTPAALAET